MLRVNVPLADRSYDVVIGEGAVAELAGLLPRSATRVAVVTQPGIPLAVSLPDHDVQTHVDRRRRGRRSRCPRSRRSCAASPDRGSPAATSSSVSAAGSSPTWKFPLLRRWHRGTLCGADVATTLLAMVDAAIGGKTGVNLPEGKNLVGGSGSRAVWCVISRRSTTLPPREYAVRAGRDGEVPLPHR